MAAGQQHLAGYDIFADGPDMLPGIGGGNDLHPLVVQHDHVLGHDHRVIGRMDGVAGIHHQKILPFDQGQGRGFPGGGRFFRGDGDAVHSGGIEQGRAAAGVDRGRGDPSQSLGGGDGFEPGLDQRFYSRQILGFRFFDRRVVQIQIALCHIYSFLIQVYQHLLAGGQALPVAFQYEKPVRRGQGADQSGTVEYRLRQPTVGRELQAHRLIGLPAG